MAFSASLLSCGRATVGVLFVLILLMQTERMSGDPDALQDFCVADTKSSVFMNGRACLNPNEASPKHFMTSDLRRPGNLSANLSGVKTVAASSLNMPDLNTLGIMMVRVDMAVRGVFPTHIHTRATEMVYIVEGTVFWLRRINYKQTLLSNAGSWRCFCDPQGNPALRSKNAFFLLAFNSRNPGYLNVPSTSFASSPGIPKEVLAKSFSISLQEVEHIRKNLGGT